MHHLLFSRSPESVVTCTGLALIELFIKKRLQRTKRFRELRKTQREEIHRSLQHFSETQRDFTWCLQTPTFSRFPFLAQTGSDVVKGWFDAQGGQETKSNTKLHTKISVHARSCLCVFIVCACTCVCMHLHVYVAFRLLGPCNLQNELRMCSSFFICTQGRLPRSQKAC